MMKKSINHRVIMTTAALRPIETDAPYDGVGRPISKYMYTCDASDVNAAIGLLVHVFCGKRVVMTQSN